MTFVGLAALFLGFPVLIFGSDGKEHRPFSEMKGGCENYAFDMKQELSLWKSQAL